jgi:hypothetical protein
MAENGDSTGGEGWSPADQRLALAIASGHSLKRAAQIAHVSQRTATRRAADPVFRAEVARLRRDLLARSTGRLIASTSRAAAALVKLLESDQPAVALGAAKSILDHANRGVEVEEIAGRLERIEAHLAEGTVRRGGL